MHHLTSASIDVCRFFAQMHDPQAGTLVAFNGEPRVYNQGRKVQYLEYEAMANKMFAAIREDALHKWGLNKVLRLHRTGKVGISGSAILVITCSTHCKEAYETNEYIVNRIKHEAPIWKYEYYEDGSYSWTHNCNCHNHQLQHNHLSA